MGWTCKTKASIDYANMTTESAALAYRINWSLNQPAMLAAVVNDDSGGKSQTYDTSYLGTSAILIEQPTATEIFRGRIIAAEPNPAQGLLVLRGEDWLGQLADRRINFDTRENLGNNYREYPLNPVLQAGTRYAAIDGTHIYLPETDLGEWGADTYKNMTLVLPHKYLGNQKEILYPYNEVVTPANAPMTTDAPADGETNLLAADGNVHELEDDVAGAYVVYYFRSMAKHSIGSAGALVDRIDEASITIDIATEAAGSAYILLYDFVAASYTIYPDGWLVDDTNGKTIRRTLPISPDVFSLIFDSDGYFRVKVLLAEANSWVKIDQLSLTISYTVDTAHTETHSITGSGNLPDYNYLNLGDSIEDDGWVNYWPISITQVATVYIASLVTTYDELYTLDASHNVTASTNYICRHFHRESPLQILKELARADNTDFWLDPWDGDSLDLHWNDPYNVAGAPTWSDTDILTWTQCGRRLSDVMNEWFVDGLVSGDYKVSGSDSDANSITDYGRRTGYFNNPDIAVNQEATDEADRRVTRMKDARFNLNAVWNGFKTTTLGSVVHVHSTKFNLDTDYVVVEKEYDSRTAVTTFTLTPRATVLNPPVPLAGLARRLDDRITNLESRLERASRYTEVWS